jgi:hypothetical protein
MTLDLNCNMDFASYPFDTQRCSVEIASCEYSLQSLAFFFQQLQKSSFVFDSSDSSAHCPHFSVYKFAFEFNIILQCLKIRT